MKKTLSAKPPKARSKQAVHVENRTRDAGDQRLSAVEQSTVEAQEAHRRALDFDRLNALAAHRCAATYVPDCDFRRGNWQVVRLAGGHLIASAPTLSEAVDKALELLAQALL